MKVFFSVLIMVYYSIGFYETLAANVFRHEATTTTRHHCTAQVRKFVTHKPSGCYRPLWNSLTFHKLMKDTDIRHSFLNELYPNKHLKQMVLDSSVYLTTNKDDFPVVIGIGAARALLSINILHSALLPTTKSCNESHAKFLRRYVLTGENHPYTSVYGFDLMLCANSHDRCDLFTHSLQSNKYPLGVHYCYQAIGTASIRNYGDWRFLLNSSSLTPSHVNLLVESASVKKALELCHIQREKDGN